MPIYIKSRRYSSTYRFANVHVTTILDGYFTLLVLLLRWSARRQGRDALVDHDALFDPGSTAQKPNFPDQNHGNRAQTCDQQHQGNEHANHNFVELARRHVRVKGLDSSLVESIAPDEFQKNNKYD